MGWMEPIQYEEEPQLTKRTLAPLLRWMAIVGIVAVSANCNEYESPTTPSDSPVEPAYALSSTTTSITPSFLRPPLGPLVRRSSTPLLPALDTYDTRFGQNEVARFRDFLACENTCFREANHYGGLRSRLMWAIRTGQPYGPAATDESRHAYARGRRIVRRYLRWSRNNGYSIDWYNNTGLPDIEIVYRLDGDADAYKHLWVSASRYSKDRYGYQSCSRPQGYTVREPTVALQALSAAHRLGIPFRQPTHLSGAGFDGSQGSWKATGVRQIQWLKNCISADGSVFQTVYGSNVEAYFFAAWMATELLRWNASVEWRGDAYNMAKLVMDHIIHEFETKYKPKGWSTLPYLSYQNSPAYDLAAFYIWPALALWQQTGNAKYREFARTNLVASNRAYIAKMKQFNQTYSSLGEGTEALLLGASWK